MPSCVSKNSETTYKQMPFFKIKIFDYFLFKLTFSFISILTDVFLRLKRGLPSTNRGFSLFSVSYITRFFHKLELLIVIQLRALRIRSWRVRTRYLSHLEIGFKSLNDHLVGKRGPGTLVYQVGHHLLLAHAKVYRLYDNFFRPSQQGIFLNI